MFISAWERHVRSRLKVYQDLSPQKFLHTRYSITPEWRMSFLRNVTFKNSIVRSHSHADLKFLRSFIITRTKSRNGCLITLKRTKEWPAVVLMPQREFFEQKIILLRPSMPYSITSPKKNPECPRKLEKSKHGMPSRESYQMSKRWENH